MRKALLSLSTLAALSAAAAAQIAPGSGSDSDSGSGADSGSGSDSGSDSYQYCGDWVRTGSEVCDDGSQNGQPGYCNATCTAVLPRTPFSDPARAPEVQSLEYGRVLGSLAYEATFELGELPGVGLSPGFSVAARLRTGSGAGRCGPACDVPTAVLAHDGAALVLDDGGRQRRFEATGATWLEVAPSSDVVFRPATAAVAGSGIAVTEVGGILTRQFDTAGRETQRITPWGSLALAYDDAGQLVSATNAAGAQLALAYDASGRLSSVTEPTGFTMTLRYSDDGHLISLEGPPDGSVTPNFSFGWMDSDLTSVGRLGFNPVTLQYDRGLVSFARDVDGTAYAFWSSPDVVAVMDSSMLYTQLGFAAERLVQVSTNAGDQTDYVRDELGRVIEIRVATSGADQVTRMTYDAANHVLSVTDPDGWLSLATYDTAGNLTSTTSPDGLTSLYGYDAAGHMTSARDPLGHTATTTYDGNGLALSSSANGITTSQTYNARGQIATSTDGFGITTTYSYTADGSLTSVSRPGSPTVTIARTSLAPGEQVVVTRGGETQTTVTDLYGRVTAASASSGATAFSYDPVTGLPSSVTTTFRGQTQTATATYTNTGDPAAIWINGQQRQSAARTVPPGNAWIPAGTGSGSGSLP